MDPKKPDPNTPDPKTGDDQSADLKTGDDPKGASSTTPAPAKVEFTPEQQAAIDALVAERVRRAERTAAQRAKDEADEAARRAQMDEVDRLKAEKDDAEKAAGEAAKRADKAIVRAEARVASLAAGVPAERLDRVLRLLDLDDIEVENGAPDGAAVEAAVKALKTDVPELFGGKAPRRSGADMDDGDNDRTWTRAQIAALTPKEYEKHEAEIDKAMREGRIVD